MKELLISIPGNPSIPHLYQSFYQSILSHKPHLEIITLCHLGQSSEIPAFKNDINLANNFAQHRVQIESLIKESNADKVYLLGHSLGSCSIISHYQYYINSVDKIILTCPFHTISRIQRLMRRLKNPVINKAAEVLLWQLLKYESLGNKFIEGYVGSKQHTQEIRRFFLSGQRHKHFLKLLSTYHKHFLLNNYEEQVRMLPIEKVHCLFADNDAWTPEEIKACFAQDISQEMKGVPHGYPIYETQSKIVGKKVADLILGKN